MVTFDSLIARKDKIAVVGLGYVGLPLAVSMSKHFEVIGYDLKSDRIKELKFGLDRTMEVSKEALRGAKILFTSKSENLSLCRLIIVAVPTPIDEHRIPDLKPLCGASATVGKYMRKGSCIVFESTVYPGATEEVCIPIVESESGFKYGADFTVGYSPERINPGDKEHSFENIVKIVSGSNQDTTGLLSDVYGRVVKAGIHPVSSIKVAEAAKVIENTQRDINIALVNELAMIFHKMGIDTEEVLEAAGTKWNFLPFKPGLVGGHCIGVDPYYLTFKAESLGYHPEMILAGRRINDCMGKYVAEQTVKLLVLAGKRAGAIKVAVLGVTFKEDIPDIRNSRAVDIVHELKTYGIKVLVHDPLADAKEAKEYYRFDLQSMETMQSMVDAVIVTVGHRFYKKLGLSKIAGLCQGKAPIVIDVKGAFSPAFGRAKKMNITYWRL
ncbi:MAG: nucleotide sugar dehydrogenase [Desulfobacteraceae bacterium]|uniref:Nucleotide sugar dehydrogenase n=1 Tax=Candidatus Desulfaltia bathyphila TaxID=2841697 RepID=A0A8J6T7X9_9BACT|nr:nucleotide sugar dehydrogenase [Candidatus Desulfaltia bathyphila]MBL7195691.1 nucleotide sugar dehydrogenase [Desulfobacterales bacterium]